jgi:GMP synthase-like glutamine amidotransferase
VPPCTPGCRCWGFASARRCWPSNSSATWFAPLFSTLRPLVFSWHNDAIVLPPEATLLARSETCAVQGFRLRAPGSVTGLQFHLEADAAKIARQMVK